MQQGVRTLALAAVFALFPAVTMSTAADRFAHDDAHTGRGPHVQLGPRPFYLVDKMDPSGLKRELQRCADRPFFYQTDFSIDTGTHGSARTPSAGPPPPLACPGAMRLRHVTGGGDVSGGSPLLLPA